MIALVLLLATAGLGVQLQAQEGLEAVDALASAGRTEEARATLESWWEDDRPTAGRRDRQRALWLRAVLTVDPSMAGLDYQRLVLGYPGGPYSDDALTRLGFISAADGNLVRAADFFRTLVRDYPRSPERRGARAWLSENGAAVEEAEEALRTSAPPPVETALSEALARYAVQLGAFLSEELAERLMVLVEDAGFTTRLVRVRESALIHVRTGSYADRAAAVELMRRIRELGYDATIAADVALEAPVG